MKDERYLNGYYLTYTNLDKSSDVISKSIWHPNLKSAENGRDWLIKNNKGCNIQIISCREE